MAMNTSGTVTVLKSEQDEMAASASVYNSLVLSIYDLYVIQFSNSFVWRCPSADILELYNQNISANHLDIGVGTGYFLDRCRFPVSDPQIALLDLNPNTLDTTAGRLRRYAPETYVGDVTAPVTSPATTPPATGFDSIGLNYVLHCLAGDMRQKGVVFQNLRPLLNEGGVLFGSTILGEGVQHNFLGRQLMRTYNAKGIFGNAGDNLFDLDTALGAHFSEYDIEVQGCVALFRATA